MLREQWQRNLAAVSIAQVLIMMAWSFFYPFIPLYLQTMGVQGDEAAAQWAGAISAASAISMVFCQPLWGVHADRTGRKPMVVRAMVGGGTFTLLMGLANSPELLLLLRFLQGAVSGMVPASNALLASCTPRSRLGFALGLMQVAMFIGLSVGPLGGGFVADTIGYRASFFIAGAATILAGVIVAVFAREDFTPQPPDAARRGAWSQSLSLMRTTVVPVVVVVIFLISFGATIVTPMLSLFIANLSGGDSPATAAGVVLATTGAASAVGALVLGRLSDRVGHGRILTFCLLGAAVTCFPQALVQEVWQLVVLRVLLGLFLGGLMPSANALLAAAAPASQRGAAFGLTSTSHALSNATAPLSGAAITTFMGMRPVFVATGLLYAFSWAWVALGLRQRLGHESGDRGSYLPSRDRDSK